MGAAATAIGSRSCDTLSALVQLDVVRRIRMSRNESQSVFLSRRDLLRLASASAAGALIAGAYDGRPGAASIVAASCLTVPTLPQNDPTPAERAAVLAAERAMYVYNYALVPPLAIANSVPAQDQFSAARNQLFLENFAKILQNAGAIPPDKKMGTATSLDDYAAQFPVIPLPPIQESFQRDSSFAWLRLGGMNPGLLRRVT